MIGMINNGVIVVTKETSKATLTATGLATQYGYDQLNNLKTVTDPTGGVTTMNYDMVNRLFERILPNGIKSTYFYNDDDQVISLVHKDSNGTVLASVAYERKGTGEPTKITREDGSYVSLEYDSALRLTKESYFTSANVLEQRIAYSYDASGKRTAVVDSEGTHGYTYNNAYQLQSVGTDTYAYDTDGRLDTFSRDGGTVNLDHDSYDRLTQVNDGSGTVTSYLYDAQGNRIGENQGATQRRYLVGSEGGLSAAKLIADGSGNVVSSYVYSGGYTPFLRLDADGNAVYYLTDVMGSVIGLANQSGQKSASFAYDAFGNLRKSSGADSAAVTGGDFRFQGQWLESESGLYYFRARDYDSKTGLFLSRDAVAPTEQQPESMNPYQFTYQNPLIYSDPSGMFSLSELNAAQSIQSTLAQQAYYNVRQQLVSQAQGVITNVLTSTLQTLLQSIIPGGELLNTVNGALASAVSPGNTWERLLTDAVCDIVLGNFQQSVRDLWLQARVLTDGTPTRDGLNCGGYTRTPVARVISTAGLGGSGSVPDFIIKNGGPYSEDPKLNPGRGFSKALLIGDIKSSWQAAYNSVESNSNQWQAIMGYANFARGHQILPAALYVTLIAGKQTEHETIVKDSLRKGVFVFLLTLFPFAK